MISDPGRRNPNLWCPYHREHGHLTEDCRMLKQHFEDLVKEGHLKEYVEDSRVRATPGSLTRKELRSDQQKEKPVGVIDVVHGTTDPSEVAAGSVRQQRKMVAHLREVYRATTQPRMVHAGGRKNEKITFTDEDLLDVVHPHNDALVLTLRIQEYDVRRILIDPGSSSEIMYVELFDKLRLSQTDLRPTSMPLYGFSG